MRLNWRWPMRLWCWRVGHRIQTAYIWPFPYSLNRELQVFNFCPVCLKRDP